MVAKWRAAQVCTPPLCFLIHTYTQAYASLRKLKPKDLGQGCVAIDVPAHREDLTREFPLPPLYNNTLFEQRYSKLKEVKDASDVYPPVRKTKNHYQFCVLCQRPIGMLFVVLSGCFMRGLLS